VTDIIVRNVFTVLMSACKIVLDNYAAGYLILIHGVVDEI